MIFKTRVLEKLICRNMSCLSLAINTKHIFKDFLYVCQTFHITKNYYTDFCSLIGFMTRDSDLIFSDIWKKSFPFVKILQISQNQPSLDIQELILKTPWFNKNTHPVVILSFPLPSQMCLGLVKVWHRWVHSSMPKMIPLEPIILSF